MLLNSNTTISVKRLPSWNKREYTVLVVEWEPADLQPADDTIKAIYDWAPGWEIFTLYCDFMDIQHRDLITDASGKKYKVEWVKPYTSFYDSHVEVTIRSDDSNS